MGEGQALSQISCHPLTHRQSTPISCPGPYYRPENGQCCVGEM